MAMSRSFGGTLFTTRAADGDLAGGDVLQAGDHAQQRGLAAARGADQHHELAVGDVDADAVQDLDRAERLAHVADVDRRHSSPRFFLLLRAWSACRPVTLPTLRPERACNGHALQHPAGRRRHAGPATMNERGSIASERRRRALP